MATALEFQKQWSWQRGTWYAYRKNAGQAV